MKFRDMLASASAALLLVGANVAQANSAKSLSLANSPAVDRAATEASEGNQAVGGFLIPLLAVVAVVAVVLVVSGDDSDSN